MITKNKNLALMGALILSMNLVSCGPKDADKVGEAQLCLDKATQGTAAACMEKIDGIDSTAANALRCSANFIDEGFTSTTRFQKAISALSEKSGGDTNTLTFLSWIAFSSKGSAADNSAFATQTYNYCVASKAKGLTLLGSMAMTATTIAGFASGGALTGGSGTDVPAAITSLLSNPASVETVGTAIIATYTASCQGSAVANQGVCDQINSYLNDGGTTIDITDPTAVGQAILDKWKTLTPTNN